MSATGNRIGILAAVVGLAACSSARAQPPPPEPRSHTLTFTAKLKKVIVENSSVATAMILSPTRLKLEERGVGQTHVWLVFGDEGDDTHGEIRAYEVSVDPNELKVVETPDVPLPRESTTRTQGTRPAAGTVQQVRTKVRILEASKAALEDLGIEWGKREQGRTEFSPRLGFLTTGKRADGAGVGTYAGLVDLLEQLEEEDEVRTISTPDLLATEGTKAELILGGQVPIPVAKGEAGDAKDANVEYRGVGLMLSITPEVARIGHILLQL